MFYDTELLEIRRNIKKALANYDSYNCISSDLENSDFAPSQYSDDLYLFRSNEDGLIYIHDSNDETDGKVAIDDLKIIVDNISRRELDEKHERSEIDHFLNSEDE